jgi:hypothetical protein
MVMCPVISRPRSTQRQSVAEDVYRLGKRDVHHAFRSGGVEFEHDSCRLDGRGNAWVETPPEGPRCPVCFAGMVAAAPARGSRPRGGLAAVGAAVALALAAAVWASDGVGPVSYYASPSPYVEVTASGDALFSFTPSVTPGPPVPPSETPALTPAPTATAEPAPAPVVVVYVLPGPTPRPNQEAAMPTSKPCYHPGEHLGVDACKWPHNR